MFRLSCVFILFVTLLPACDKTGNEELQIPQFVSRQQDSFVLNNGRALMTVSPAKGGRIVSLTMDGFELLAPENSGKDKVNSFGSVLWSSPQSEWNWPPLPALNSNPYAVGCNHNKTAIVLTSEIDPKTGYQFIKYYSLGDKSETFKLRYKIINHSASAKDVGAIENTRIKPAGLAFFPQGDTEPNSGIFYPLNVHLQNGIVWHQFEPEKIRQDHHKVMMDGKEGWLAYSLGQYLLVRRFPDALANKVADTERQIELFGHSDRTFCEMKHQSELHHLKPGESFEWEVEWQIKKLPDATDTQLGSQDLLKAARSQD